METTNVDRELTDSDLRRAVESLWPDRKGQHLTDEEIAYIAEIYASSPDEMASPRVQYLTSHLFHCSQCLEDVSALADLLRQEAPEPVSCPEIDLSFLAVPEEVPAPRPTPEPRRLSPSEQGVLISLLELAQGALETGEEILSVTQRWTQKGMRALRIRVAKLLERKVREAQAKQAGLTQALEHNQSLQEALEDKMEQALRLAQGYLSSRGQGDVLADLAQKALELLLYIVRPLQRAFYEFQLDLVRAKRERLEKELQYTIRLQNDLEVKLAYISTVMAQEEGAPLPFGATSV